MFSSKLQFFDELNDQDEIFECDNQATPQKSSLKDIFLNSQNQQHSKNNNDFKQTIQSKTQNEIDENFKNSEQQKDLFSQQNNERRQEALNRFISNYENDLYFILNVSHNASKQEIKSQFKKLSLMYHPDKQQQNLNTNALQAYSNKEDNKKELNFAKILTAYNILSNDELKEIYDEEGYQEALNAMNKNDQI